MSIVVTKGGAECLGLKTPAYLGVLSSKHIQLVQVHMCACAWTNPAVLLHDILYTFSCVSYLYSWYHTHI